MTNILNRIARRLTMNPRFILLIAAALLLAGVALAIQNDRIGKDEKLRQASVQAEILASSIAAPLAFDDEEATTEYLNALHVNPEILAAGAYRANGMLVAGFSQRGTELPRHNLLAAPAFTGRDWIVTAKVAQGDTQLGTVYLRASIESWTRRAIRYLGIVLIVTMGSLLVAVLGASYASLSDTHRKLQMEIEGRQQAEEALRQSQKMEAMGQLTGGIAHDFNNLLMVASSGLDLLERTTDAAKREKLKIGIRQAVDRGAKLTQQLLTFARRSPLNAEVIDVVDRIRGMAILLDRSMRENVIVELRLPDDIWPVHVDASELEVALLNIALNARDAMPEGGTIIIRADNIRGESHDAGDRVRISVADTGTGIEANMITKVFEPFFTTKGVGKGTGLGLSQVYGFARSSGGEIQIDSTVGRGTTLSLILPRSAMPLPQSTEEPAALITVRAASRRILLVEDDDNVATMVGAMLDELGYPSQRAISADAAIEWLDRDADFELILSDMVMPGALNGLDLVNHIAERHPMLPVILMTGYSSAAAAAMQQGVRVMLKPYRLGKLAAEIDAAIASR